jgi:site-specific recombinase XerD
MRLMAHLSRWLAEEGLGAHDLRPSEVERFVAARRAAGYSHHLSLKGMQPMLGLLRELGVAPTHSAPAPQGPVEEVLERFRRYLTLERGMGSPAVYTYVERARPFLCGRISVDGRHVDLEHLSAGDVTAFVVACCPQQSRGVAKLTVTALRSLLRFLHLEGAIERPLTAAVPSVAGWRLAGLPKGLEPAQVRKLLASCDRRTHIGRRDFALLTTLARLGLRAGEIAALKLDDIDWRAGEIVVRGKGNRVERLPFPADVGEAVAAWLLHGRPESSEGRTVFVRIRAPHRPLTTGSVSSIVAAAARRAGLGEIRAHRLRHTAATLMLRAGATLPEIGQVLRHRCAATTAIYAKVNRDALRTIARPWLGGVE